MLFAGTARALKRIASQCYPDQTINRQEEIWCIVCVGYIIAGIWIIFLWPDVHLVTISLRHIPLLAFNATITAVTLLSGTSLLLSNDEEDAEDPKQSVGSAKPRTSDALTLLTLVGIIGSYSTLSVRRSYTNVFQYVYFSLAVLCIIYNTQHESSILYDRVSRDDSSSWETPNDFSSIDEENFSSDERGTRLSTRKESRNQKLEFTSLLGGLGLFLIWSLYICSNFATRPSPHPSTSLDTEYIPQFPLEIVISMYREPIEDVADFIASLEHTSHLSDAIVTIYTKDYDVDVDHIRQRTGATRVTKLPNIGREGETYLNHITTHWDKLAKHTIFLQADVHNSREFYPRLRNYFDPERTGYLNLGAAEICHCENCGDRFFWSDNADLFPQYYARIYNTSSSACKDVSLSYKGQFIASAARIRGIDKAIYHDLRHAFVDEDSWAHQPEFLRGRPDSMTAPQFGYAMERMWNLVFQCEGMDVAWKCPTMISGWRIGGDEGDCQCFDT
ncbi:hypothetical protein FB567DRAFT_430520 [Paraphoma chrysanthemicola]|uniref:Uncharacterized protein n=1 Tax=Paraphoma chrysanthemicola TaxID=798071 RepID=A0A8K0RKT3_9PLEO|nr:hypothetical protein FB567DRAFT_430520 [Paraphoma chrysanthemicola]